MNWQRTLMAAVVILGLAGGGRIYGRIGAAAPQAAFAFVENRGLAPGNIHYIGNGPEFRAYFSDRGVILQNRKSTLTMSFAGSFAGAAGMSRLQASEPNGALVNVLRGSDPAKWNTGLPMYGTLLYREVWPGIDVRYRAEGAHLKSEFLMAPGAEAQAIRLNYDADTIATLDGGLIVCKTGTVMRESKPVAFQEAAGGVQRAIDAAYVIYRDGTAGFELGAYDHTKPIIIDPVILFSGYAGGSTQDTIEAITTSPTFTTIVAGYTNSQNLPASAGAKQHNAGGVDAFVSGYDPTGKLIFCTYLGGSGDDRAFGVVTDAAGSIYVTGWTGSTNFPTLNPLQTHLSGSRDAFVTKLSANGGAILYSTYLGGSGVDAGYAIALDATNSAYVIGDTTSANLPVTASAFQKTNGGGQDVFVAKLAPTGNALSFLTYFGGSAADHGAAIKVDASGAIAIGGNTYSYDLPTVQPYQPQPGGGEDGFVARLNSTGSHVLFSTYLGGSGGSAGASESVNGLATDAFNNILVAGTTSSADFPVTAGALQATYGGGTTDGFIARYNPSGILLESTYLGGSSADGINGLATDFHGGPCVTGYTQSADFPVQRGVQNAIAGGLDAFVAKLDPLLSTVVYATYIGGSGNDSGNAITVDAMTNIAVAGSTGSMNLPTAGAIASHLPSMLASFVTRIGPSWSPTIFFQGAFYVDTWHSTGTVLRASLFGNPTDIPVVGDWDGSGVKRMGVFRNGQWLLDMNGNGYFDAGDKTVSFGQAGDIPVVGDWDGTGKIKLGLFRAGTFILDLSGHLSGVATGVADASFPFGQSGDIPVVADWNGSGTAKVGVFRSGAWLVDYNGDRVFNGQDRTYNYGQAGDSPVTGDWNGDGRAKIGVVRNGSWILNYTGSNMFTALYVDELGFYYGPPSGSTPLVW